MLAPLSTAHLDYEGSDGLYHTIRPVNIIDRQMMLTRIQQMHSIIEKEPDKQLSFANLWNGNKHFRYICEQILTLNAIDLNTISLELAFTLLLPSEQSDLGLLIELNFTEAELLPTIEREETRTELASMLGRIWAAVEDFNQAYDAMITLPASDLFNALDARSASIESMMKSPEERKKEKMQAKAKELLASRLSGSPNAPA